MWQQAGVWGLHQSLQLRGLGVGADGLPAGPGRAAGGGGECTSCPPTALPSPSKTAPHPTNDNTLHCYSHKTKARTAVPTLPRWLWLPEKQQCVQERALHRKPSLALRASPFPSEASLSWDGEETRLRPVPTLLSWNAQPKGLIPPSCSSRSSIYVGVTELGPGCEKMFPCLEAESIYFPYSALWV